MVDVLLGCLLWAFILYGVIRGYRRAQQVDRYVIITWIIFISFGVVFTLRIPAVQPFLDRYFYDYPATFLLSLLAVLVAVAAYSLSLKWLMQRSPDVFQLRSFHPMIIWLALCVAGLLLFVMAAHVAGHLSSFRTQHLMKWLVEGYGLLHAALIFVPVNYVLFRHEQVFQMRVKHLATLVLTATFALSAFCSVVFLPSMILTERPYQGEYLIPRVPIAVLCLIIVLVPHRWLTLLRLPALMRRYVQLARLERHIGRRVAMRREPLAIRQAFYPSRTEMAIYVTVINILDNYRRVNKADARGSELVAQIDTLLPQCVGYNEIVEGLCRIRP